MIVLSAQQEVDHENSDGCARHDHKAVANKEETKHVVDLGEPNRVHDQVEFHEDSTPGKDTGKSHGWEKSEIARHWRNLSWNLVRTHGCFDDALLETEPRACEAEWDADDEPDYDHHQHSCKRNSSRSTATPYKEVKQEKGGENQTRDGKRSVEEAQLPRLAVEELVGTRCDVSADKAKQGVEYYDNGSEGTAVARREKA